MFPSTVWSGNCLFVPVKPQRGNLLYCVLWHFLELRQAFVSCSQVNLKAHHVEYNRFYIPDITSLVDIQEDYLKWFLSKAEIVSTEILWQRYTSLLLDICWFGTHAHSTSFGILLYCSSLMSFSVSAEKLRYLFQLSNDRVTSQTSLYNSFSWPFFSFKSG